MAWLNERLAAQAEVLKASGPPKCASTKRLDTGEGAEPTFGAIDHAMPRSRVFQPNERVVARLAVPAARSALARCSKGHVGREVSIILRWRLLGVEPGSHQGTERPGRPPRPPDRETLMAMNETTHEPLLWSEHGGALACRRHAPAEGSEGWHWGAWRSLTRAKAVEFEHELGYAPSCERCENERLCGGGGRHG